MTEQAPIHWLRGGSGSDRIVACPGSVPEQARYQAEPSGPAAIDGTHTHTVLSECLNHNVFDADLFVNKTLTDHEGEFTVDAERAERVNVALNYINHRIRSMHKAGIDVEVHVEKFWDAGTALEIDQWGGSADVVLVWPLGVEIIDYKDGGKLVQPSSYQLITYALGVIHTLDTTDPPNIRTTIIQPKRSNEPQFIDYDWDAFNEKAQPLIDAMRQSMNPDAPRNPGAHCKWCRGAQTARCAAYNQRISTAVNQTLTPANTATPLQIPAIDGDMSNEQLAQILDAKPLIEAMLDEANKEAIRRAFQLRVIFPGRKLTRTTAREKWVNGAAEELEKARVPKAAREKISLPTPKQFRETEYFKGLGKRKQASLNALIERPEGTLKLVLESEPGKPVELGISPASLEKAASADVPTPIPQAEPTSAPQNTFVQF